MVMDPEIESEELLLPTEDGHLIPRSLRISSKNPGASPQGFRMKFMSL
jgi:hypothetical protein